MKHKKIIFFIPTLNIGGGERVVSELSLNLADDVKINIVLFKNQTFYPYKGKLISLNIPLSNSFLFKIYYFLISLSRFKKVIKRENPDYVISFSKPANIINVLCNKKAILRIDSFMTSACKGFKGRIYKILIKLLFNKSKMIISVSKKAANDLVKNFGIEKEKIKVIYNSIDIEKIQRLAKEPLEPEFQKIFNGPVIINTGRISKEKNLALLVKTFKQVKKRVREVKLLILGQGSLEQDLRRLIKQLGLESDVYLLKWQKNPFKFLAKAKAFVLPSLREGLPYGILEAMACNLPIISVDCKSGPREILAPNTDINQEAKDIEYADYGILCPIKDENKLAEAIIEMLTNKELSSNLIRASKQRAKDFDIKKVIKQWEFLKN